MKCPFCKSYQTSVIDSRPVEDYIRRRRYHCSECNKRFTTYERVYEIDIDELRSNYQNMKSSLNSLKEMLPVVEQLVSVADDI